MDASAIRHLFSQFTGKKNYRRFVRTLNKNCERKGRLLYWQEQLWTRFVENAESSNQLSDDDEMTDSSFENIADAFAVCDIHETSLQRESVNIVYGLVYFPDDFLRAREVRFPFANEVVYGGCQNSDTRTAMVLFCKDCRQALKEWMSRHNDIAVLS